MYLPACEYVQVSAKARGAETEYFSLLEKQAAILTAQPLLPSLERKGETDGSHCVALAAPLTLHGPSWPRSTGLCSPPQVSGLKACSTMLGT